MKREKICGIYCIENMVNRRKYVGQSVDIESRRYHHFYSLRKGTHHNIFLQREYNLYNEKNFTFYILIECDKDLLDYYEIMYINELNLLNTNCGYNVSPGGAAPHYFSEAELQKRSDSIKKKWSDMDEDTKNRIVNSLQDGFKKWRSCATKDELDKINRRRLEAMMLKTPDEKRSIIEKRAASIKNTIKNRSAERSKELSAIYSNCSKKRWDNTSADIKEALRQTVIRAVYCPQLNLKFNSIKEASVYTLAQSPNIVKVCNGERNFAGTLSDGTKLTWEYVKC